MFTCSTGQHNPIKWVNLRDYTKLFWMKKPMSSMVWYPNDLSHFSGKYAYQIAAIIYHFLPAYILDCVALLLGKKAKLVYFY